jgi:hypothetical protein
MTQELCWLIVPVCGLLSQMGGTWNKAFRRYGIPILMAVTWCVFMGFDWRVLLMALLQWGAYCLPITLKGDSVNGNGLLNWLWLPVLGILICSSPLVMDTVAWPATVIFGLTYGIFCALSNTPATAKWFQWKFVELFSGMFPAAVLCFTLTL